MEVAKIFYTFFCCFLVVYNMVKKVNIEFASWRLCGKYQWNQLNLCLKKQNKILFQKKNEYAVTINSYQFSRMGNVCEISCLQFILRRMNAASHVWEFLLENLSETQLKETEWNALYEKYSGETKTKFQIIVIISF